MAQLPPETLKIAAPDWGLRCECLVHPRNTGSNVEFQV
jgi:hypothetical protein